MVMLKVRRNKEPKDCRKKERCKMSGCCEHSNKGHSGGNALNPKMRLY